jgi:hypothetical protein
MSLATAGRRCSTRRRRRLRSRAPRRHRSWSWSTPSGLSRAPLGRRLFSQKTRIAEVDEEPDVRSNPRLILAPVAVLSPYFFHFHLLATPFLSLSITCCCGCTPPPPTLSPSSLCCSSVAPTSRCCSRTRRRNSSSPRRPAAFRAPRILRSTALVLLAQTLVLKVGEETVKVAC